jgi:hypothetical protein
LGCANLGFRRSSIRFFAHDLRRKSFQSLAFGLRLHWALCERLNRLTSKGSSPFWQRSLFAHSR